jgi:ATP-dependent helicase HrpB
VSVSPPALPIDAVLEQVIASVRDNPISVVIAPPGAGKTTGLPPAIMAANILEQNQLWLTQPRRLAARAAASRIAQLRGQTIGQEIGYQVRFEKQGGGATRLWVMTTGILLRRLQLDPCLDRVGLVILDEFHERSLEADLSLAMLRRVQQTVRPDLRLLIMSATLDGRGIAERLGHAPVIESLGRSFPVDVQYLVPRQRDDLHETLARGVGAALTQTPGNVLVFLPGVGEIHRAARELESVVPRDVELLMLFGELASEQQDRAIAPSDRRRVVLATNVAETSITIPGVTAVVDSGLARVMITDQERGLPRLELQKISQASADQRAGRAGRTAPGRCWRLWPAAEIRAPFTPPEILRGDLTGAILQLSAWGERDPLDLPWLTPPTNAAIETATRTLEQLAAIDIRGPTALGRRLLALPTHPRIARLLVAGAEFGIGWEACLAAALLTERDPFRTVSSGAHRPPTRVQHRTRCDLADRVQALLGERLSLGILPEPHPGAEKNVRRVAEQFRRLLPEPMTEQPPTAAPLDESLARALLTALPDRVAKRRQVGSPRGRMVGGRGVALGPPSAVHEADLFLCIDLNDLGQEATVRSAAALERDWLEPSLVRISQEAFFHPSQLQVVARARTYYLDLMIDEQPIARADPIATAELLAEEAIARWPQAFPADDPAVEQLVARLQCLAEWCPELDLPRIDRSVLHALARQLAHGRRSFADLREAPWTDAILGLLDDRQRIALQSLTPGRITLPKGQTVAIRYEAEKPPVLAARIQDLFGWRVTPRIANGRVALTLHLLAPNHRPQQITTDLASFWQNTYPQVRKDLRRRYPKHAWPEDPLSEMP